MKLKYVVASLQLILIVFLVSTFSYSQSDYDSTRSYQLEPVVVTGTRYQLPKNIIPASITVIDNEEIQETHNVNVIRSIENKVPGLFLNNNYFMGFGVGTPSAGTINIRGIGGSPNTQILVLIDGQPQFMGMFGHPIIDALTFSTVQKVEVIRGPASILYGSNAMGGAVNIISKKIPDKLKLNLSSFYGSFNSYNVTGDAGYSNNKFGFYASYNNSGTDGNRTGFNNVFKNSTGFTKLEYSLNKRFKFEIDGNVSKSRFVDPGPVYHDTTNIYDYLRTRSAFSILNSFENFEGALKLYFSYGKHDALDGWHSYDEMKGITFYQNFNLVKGMIFTAGADYKNYGGKGSNRFIPPFILKGLDTYYSNNETAVYGLISDSLLKNLNLQAGLRYTKNSLFKEEYTPQFGIAYSPLETTTLKASAGKGFQSPTIVDLYLFPVANEDLKPEHVWNYEIGMEQKFLNYRAVVELTFYYDEGDNIIVVTPPLFVKNNSGSFIHKGIELLGKFLINENINASLIYSYIHTGKPALYAPENNLNIHIDYHIGSVQALLDLKQVLGLYSNVEKQIKQNYFLADLNINYQLLNSLQLFARGENLFNTSYEINDGYPMPGRGIIAGVEFNY